jgi:glucan endo-1,3-alpha-glucosidase
VSTFAGESCTFGQGSAPKGWKNEFAGHPDLKGKIYFVPSFFIDPVKFGDFRDVMDGDFNVRLLRRGAVELLIMVNS